MCSARHKERAIAFPKPTCMAFCSPAMSSAACAWLTLIPYASRTCPRGGCTRAPATRRSRGIPSWFRCSEWTGAACCASAWRRRVIDRRERCAALACYVLLRGADWASSFVHALFGSFIFCLAGLLTVGALIACSMLIEISLACFGLVSTLVLHGRSSLNMADILLAGLCTCRGVGHNFLSVRAARIS